jgi:hypothetical protein
MREGRDDCGGTGGRTVEVALGDHYSCFKWSDTNELGCLASPRKRGSGHAHVPARRNCYRKNRPLSHAVPVGLVKDDES